MLQAVELRDEDWLISFSVLSALRGEIDSTNTCTYVCITVNVSCKKDRASSLSTVYNGGEISTCG